MMPRPRISPATTGSLLLILLLACGGDPPAEKAPPTEEPAAAADAGLRPAEAGLGDGFVVWESQRSGAWRLWHRRLDGSDLRQLSPDEPNRHHCCAHVSPDGRWVTYLSFGGRYDRYPQESLVGTLHLLRLDGSGDRVVAEAARTYFENRAAMWKSPDELVYIDAEGYTVLHDLRDDRGERITSEPSPDHGWLINPTLTYAVRGDAKFSPYDARRRQVDERAQFGGCQPYLDAEGRWGFWVAGVGGPINRLDLATREVETILEKNDDRLPGDWGYMYFPMISPDARLLAWGASQGDHDHFAADYEIFVAPIDPATLQLVGEPVRMTRHTGPDRFPAVYLEPLPLGRHRGEAPLTVQFEPEGDASWTFELGDGNEATGARAEHTYTRAGTYSVVARRDGGEPLRGQVAVEPGAPPKPRRAQLQADGRTIEVAFDEPIAPEGIEARLETGLPVAGVEPAGDGRRLRVRLAETLSGPDRLHLQGVRDRAQTPHVLEPVALPVEAPSWPSSRERAVFLWQSGEAPNLIHDPRSGGDRAVSVEALDRAHLDHAWRMVLGDGAFRVSKEDSARIVHELQARNQMSIEMVVRPQAEVAGRNPALIVSTFGGTPNLRLGQRGDRLELVHRGKSRRQGSYQRAELMTLPVGRTSHVVVTYTPGRLGAYRDGELVTESSDLGGDFYQWDAQPLIFGGGDPEWQGRLEGVAIYSRVLSPEEVAENARRYEKILDERPEVPQTRVRAQLTARSRPPTLDEITPYRQGLVVYEYEVEEVLSGEAPDRLRVAHWAILDGETLPVTEWQTGRTVELTLEPFEANRQLEPLYVSDTLQGGQELPLYHAVNP